MSICGNGKASTAKDCGLLQQVQRGFDSLHPLTINVLVDVAHKAV